MGTASANLDAAADARSRHAWGEAFDLLAAADAVEPLGPDELDHMAECVPADRTPRTPGEEGLQDHLLMEAIYESASTGRPVTLPPAQRLDATRGPEPGPG